MVEGNKVDLSVLIGGQWPVYSAVPGSITLVSSVWELISTKYDKGFDLVWPLPAVNETLTRGQSLNAHPGTCQVRVRLVYTETKKVLSKCTSLGSIYNSECDYNLVRYWLTSLNF